MINNQSFYTNQIQSKSKLNQMTEVEENLDNKIYETLGEESYVESQNTKVDETQISIFSEFIKQLKPGVELFRISVPSIILQPCSLLEKNSTYVRPNKLILDIKKETSKEKRFIQVLSWVLSNYSTVPRKGIYGCKPYNPSLINTSFSNFYLLSSFG